MVKCYPKAVIVNRQVHPRDGGKSERLQVVGGGGEDEAKVLPEVE